MNLYGQRTRPRNSPFNLHVSGLRWDAANGYHVAITGDGRALFMARLALTHVAHDWLDCHGLMLGIDQLAGPDYRASAEAAREFYEAFVYDAAADPENQDIDVWPRWEWREARDENEAKWIRGEWE